MTKHTPGPWHSQCETDGGSPMMSIITINDGATGYLNRNSPEDDANARLIVAAPDLLAALQDIIEYSKGGTWSPGDRANALRRGEAAIAKATGD